MRHVVIGLMIKKKRGKSKKISRRTKFNEVTLNDIFMRNKKDDVSLILCQNCWKIFQCGTLIILSFNLRLRNSRLTTGVEALFNWLFNYADRFKRGKGIRGVNMCLNVMSIQRIYRNNPDIFVVNVLARDK